jgi:hypothetical protein
MVFCNDMQTLASLRQSFGGSVMVWGCITAHGRTPLVVVAGKLIGIRYWDEIVHPPLKNSPSFIQDSSEI